MESTIPSEERLPTTTDAVPGGDLPLLFCSALEDGQARVSLRRGRYLGLLEVLDLELEVPLPHGLASPAGDAALPPVRALRNSRGRLLGARFRLDEASLCGLFRRAGQRASLPASDISVRLRDGLVQVGGRTRDGRHDVEWTVRVSVRAEGQELILGLFDLRVYGAPPLPAPLLLRPLVEALVGSNVDGNETAARMMHLSSVCLAPLRLFLLRELPRHGFRVPAYDGVALHKLVVADGALDLGFSGPAAELGHEVVLEPTSPSDRLRVIDHRLGSLQCVEAEARLSAGQLEAATADYRRVLAQRTGSPFAWTRLLHILAADARRPEAAQAEARGVLAKVPSHLHARLTLAAALETQGRQDEAAELLLAVGEAALDEGQEEDATRALWKAARLLLASTTPQRATEVLARVLTLHPEEESVAEALAGRYEAEERFAELRALWAGRPRPPRSAAALRGVGRACLAAGDLGSAASAFDAAAQAARLAGEAGTACDMLLLAARAYLQLGQPDQARQRLLQLVTQRADDIEALRLLAHLLVDSFHDQRAARECLQRVVTQSRSPSADDYALLAGLEEQEFHFAEAEQALAAAAARAEEPETHARVLVHRAELLCEPLGRDAQAGALLREALALAPTSATTLTSAAALAERLGATAELRLCAAGLAERLPPEDACGWHLRAATLAAQLGDQEAAERHLRLAVELAPDPRPALRALDAHLLAGGDDAERESVLSQLADKEQQAGDQAALAGTLHQLGEVRLRLEQGTAALAALTRALELAPRDPAILASTGAAALTHGDMLLARDCLERALELASAGDSRRPWLLLQLAAAEERAGQAAAARSHALGALAETDGSELSAIARQLAPLLLSQGDALAACQLLADVAQDRRSRESKVARSAHLVRAAEIACHHLKDLERASVLLEQALFLDAGNLAALDTLEAVCRRRQDYTRVAEVLARKLALTGRHPDQQRAILLRLGEVQATHLGRPDAAAEAYSRALLTDPNCAAVHVALARHAQTRGDMAAAAFHRARASALDGAASLELEEPGPAQAASPGPTPVARPGPAEGPVQGSAQEPEHGPTQPPPSSVPPAGRSIGAPAPAAADATTPLRLQALLRGSNGAGTTPTELRQRLAAIQPSDADRAAELHEELARMLAAAGQHHQALFELLSALDLQPRRRSALELAAELYDEAGEGDQAATMRARLQALAPSPTAPR